MRADACQPRADTAGCSSCVQDGMSPVGGNQYDGSMVKEPVSFVESASRLAVLDAAVDLAEQKGVHFEVRNVGAWGPGRALQGRHTPHPHGRVASSSSQRWCRAANTSRRAHAMPTLQIALWVSYTLTNNANPGPTGQPLGWPTAATADWWRFIAARYKSRPHVFFGLLNEPQANYDGAWDARYTAAVQPVVDAIRSTGAQNLVVVGASRAWARYAQSFNLYPVVDSARNWAAGVHYYLKPAELEPAYTQYCKVRGSGGRGLAVDPCACWRCLAHTLGELLSPRMPRLPLQDHACVVEEYGPATPDYTLAEVRGCVRGLA